MASANRVIFLLLSLVAGGCEVASEATVLARIAPPDARPVHDGGVSDAGPNVPPARLQLLDRGFVAKEWMKRTYDRTFLTATELRNLKMSGVRSIRVAFGMGANAMSSALLFQESAPDVLNPEALANYDEILDEVLGQGLGVVVHPVNSDERTWTDPNYSSKLVAFWRALGRHLSTRNPETLFIKVGYDPTSSDPDAWYAVQKLLLSAVREFNPTRTLLVTPNAYTRLGDRDPVKALVEMTPVDDTNVVYDFGFFTPITFTLQGAYWREPWLLPLHESALSLEPRGVRTGTCQHRRRRRAAIRPSVLQQPIRPRDPVDSPPCRIGLGEDKSGPDRERRHRRLQAECRQAKPNQLAHRRADAARGRNDPVGIFQRHERLLRTHRDRRATNLRPLDSKRPVRPMKMVPVPLSHFSSNAH